MNYFYMALTLLFIYLKLTHVIDWSWWFVVAPIWGGFIITFVLLAGSILYIAAFGSPLDKAALKMKGYLK